MKKILFLSIFIIITWSVNAQVDSTKFNIYHQNQELILLTPEHFKPMVLIVDGDSIYNTFNTYELERRLRTGKNVKMKIYKHPDSIQAILRDRIRAIMIIERDQ